MIIDHSNITFSETLDEQNTLSDQGTTQLMDKMIDRLLINGAIRVFSYGSLIWDPCFEYAEKYTAEVKGFHRKLCIKSVVYRGTEENPGLVFGLDHGGKCKGMMFTIRENISESLKTIWAREMLRNAYIPTIVEAVTQTSGELALAFVANDKSESYVPFVKTNEMMKIVMNSEGKGGKNIDYVIATWLELRKLCIIDIDLQGFVLNYVKYCRDNDIDISPEISEWISQEDMTFL